MTSRRDVRRRRMFVLGVSLFVVSIFGCAHTETAMDVPHDSAWLSRSLQSEGVYVRDRGTVANTMPAKSSMRLVLDNAEYIDVYEFRDERDAESNARILAGQQPIAEVYRTEALVVLRGSASDAGLTRVLHKLLGNTI